MENIDDRLEVRREKMSKIDSLRVKIHQKHTSLATEKDNEFINLLDQEK